VTESDVIEDLPIATWAGPFDPALRDLAVSALEGGKVLMLPLAFTIADDERRLLEPAILGGARKNVSLDPRTGRLGNSAATPADQRALSGMMQRFADSAARLLADLLPGYAGRLERARTSFRPAEIEGRAYTPRHDDRLLHVDAFPTRPLRGRRILRLFSNVAPDGAAREWRVGEPFEEFARRFVPGVRPPLPGTATLLRLAGLTKGRRSAYDHLMLGLHDAGKLDASYQANCFKAAVSFQPGTTWLCFTDQVLHAALSGHCALEQTFHLPVEAMAHPEQAPLRVLERLTGRALV
jgi:hypothetical protein